MNWDEYLMGFARHAALKSKDPTQVGAALVGPGREVRLTAYNGPPHGVDDTPDRFERPRKYLFASHAEANLVAFAAREGIRTTDCTVYVTHRPCAACARSLIQAGITCVVAGPGTTSMPAEEFEAAGQMFAEAGVECRPLASPKPQPDLGLRLTLTRAALDTQTRRGDGLAADLAAAVKRAERGDGALREGLSEIRRLQGLLVAAGVAF